MKLPPEILRRIALYSDRTSYHTLLHSHSVFGLIVPPLEYMLKRLEWMNYMDIVTILSLWSEEPQLFNYCRKLCQYTNPSQRGFWLARHIYYYAKHLNYPSIALFLVRHGVQPFQGHWCDDVDSLEYWWTTLE